MLKGVRGVLRMKIRATVWKQNWVPTLFSELWLSNSDFCDKNYGKSQNPERNSPNFELKHRILWGKKKSEFCEKNVKILKSQDWQKNEIVTREKKSELIYFFCITVPLILFYRIHSRHIFH